LPDQPTEALFISVSEKHASCPADGCTDKPAQILKSGILKGFPEVFTHKEIIKKSRRRFFQHNY